MRLPNGTSDFYRDPEVDPQPILNRISGAIRHNFWVEDDQSLQIYRTIYNGTIKNWNKWDELETESQSVIARYQPGQWATVREA